MRVTMDFITDNGLKLPIQHKECIQGLLYKHMAPATGKFLHDNGYIGPTGRIFKMWTFSNIHAKLCHDTRSNMFIIPSKFSLTIASAYESTIIELASNLMNEEVVLNNAQLKVEKMAVNRDNVTKDTLRFRTLSPVTEYSTLSTPAGKKVTHYYCPMEKEFSELIYNNLKSKYYIKHGEMPPEHEFSIDSAGKCKEHIVMYKDTVIKAWSGVFLMRAYPKLIEIALSCGLGAKNSQGFGCIEGISNA